MVRRSSVIPRGFSRHYILTSLRECPMSGKELVDKAVAEGGGVWKASPGVIYPILGRLIEEGLIDQIDDGRYKIMMKGLETIKDLESVQNIFQKQLELLLRLGNTGRFITLDLLDRISNLAPALASNFDKMTEQERNRYKHFLRTELRKVNQQG
ncbi:MAG: PadR family transcriptional regulator [Candidatus Nitrosopolaris sp.]